MGLLQYIGGTYSKQNEDKPWDDFKHLVYYILLQIAYVDDYYKMHQYLKQKVKQYLKRIYWPQVSKQYRNTKFLYKWHALEYQAEGILIV